MLYYLHNNIIIPFHISVPHVIFNSKRSTQNQKYCCAAPQDLTAICNHMNTNYNRPRIRSTILYYIITIRTYLSHSKGIFNKKKPNTLQLPATR